MALTRRLYSEFNDDQGIAWEIRMLADSDDYPIDDFDYGRAKAGDTPLLITWEGQGKPFDPIRGSRLEWQLAVEDQDLVDMMESTFGEPEDAFRIEIWRDGEKFWTGTLLTDLHQEPDAYFPFVMTCAAIDGLARLKKVPFDDGEGGGLSGRISQVEVLAFVLAKLNYGIRIRTADDWYPTGASTGAGDDPLAQTEIAQDRFETLTQHLLQKILGSGGVFGLTPMRSDLPIEQPISCYDVLDSILRRKQLRIMMTYDQTIDELIWFVMQRDEHRKATTRTRLYDEEGTFVEAATIDLTTSVNSTTVRVIKGGNKILAKRAAAAKILFDHGKAEANVLQNSDVAGGWTYTPAPAGSAGVMTFGPGDSFKVTCTSGRIDFNQPGQFGRATTVPHDLIVLPDQTVKLAVRHRALAWSGILPGDAFSMHYYWRLKIGSKYVKATDTPADGRLYSLEDADTWNREAVISTAYRDLLITTPELPTGTHAVEFSLTQPEAGIVDVPSNYVGSTYVGPINQNVFGIYFAGVRGDLIIDDEADEKTAKLTRATVADTGITIDVDLGTVLIGDGPTSQHLSRITESGASTSTWTRSGEGDDLGIDQLLTTMAIRAFLQANGIFRGTIKSSIMQAHHVLEWRGMRLAQNAVTFDAKRSTFKGEWQETRLDVDAIEFDDPLSASEAGATVVQDVAQANVLLGNRVARSEKTKALTSVTDQVPAGSGITSIPIETMSEALLVAGEEVVLVNSVGAQILTLTLAADQEADDDTLTVEAFTAAEDVEPGALIFKTDQQTMSLIVQNRDAIALRVQYGEILSQFTVEAASITAETNVFKSNTWDGTVDGSGTITVYGTAGWAITGSGMIQFQSGRISNWDLSTNEFTADSGAAFINAATPAIGLGAVTDYFAGVGFWVGKNTGSYKLHIGDPSGQYLRWTGTQLEISGVIVTGSSVASTTNDSFTINSDLTNANVDLIFGRTTGGSATMRWNGSYFNFDKAVRMPQSLTVGNRAIGLGGYVQFDGTSATTFALIDFLGSGTHQLIFDLPDLSGTGYTLATVDGGQEFSDVGSMTITGNLTVAGVTNDSFVINSDLGDVNVDLVFGRTTGGNATIRWNGTVLNVDKATTFSASLTSVGQVTTLSNPAGNATLDVYGATGAYNQGVTVWRDGTFKWLIGTRASDNFAIYANVPLDASLLTLSFTTGAMGVYGAVTASANGHVFGSSAFGGTSASATIVQHYNAITAPAPGAYANLVTGIRLINNTASGGGTWNSPALELTHHSDTDGNDFLNSWYVHNWGFVTPGAAGGVLVFTNKHQITDGSYRVYSTFAIDEIGRTIIGYTKDHGSQNYGFWGEDFGSWMIHLAGSTIVGWPETGITADLRVTGDLTVDGSFTLSGIASDSFVINSDLGDVNADLVFGRTTGGNATIRWNGVNIILDKSVNAINLSSTIPLQFYGAGDGTYNKTVIYSNTTDQFSIDVARATDSGGGTPLDFIVSWRGAANSGFKVNPTTFTIYSATLYVVGDLTVDGTIAGLTVSTGTNNDSFTINADATNANVDLVLNRTGGGAATLRWDGTTVTIDKAFGITTSLTLNNAISLLWKKASGVSFEVLKLDGSDNLLMNAPASGFYLRVSPDDIVMQVASSAITFNLTTSVPALKIGSTTVIDSSRNVTGATANFSAYQQSGNAVYMVTQALDSSTFLGYASSDGINFDTTLYTRHLEINGTNITILTTTP